MYKVMCSIYSGLNYDLQKHFTFRNVFQVCSCPCSYTAAHSVTRDIVTDSLEVDIVKDSVEVDIVKVSLEVDIVPNSLELDIVTDMQICYSQFIGRYC